MMMMVMMIVMGRVKIVVLKDEGNGKMQLEDWYLSHGV